MKKTEVLAQADALCKNSYTEAEKMRWCTELDNILKTEYQKEATDAEYTAADAPYDVMYVDFILAKCCFYQRDYDAYNQHITAFNNKLSDFSNQYLRTHLPKRETANQIGKWWEEV